MIRGSKYISLFKQLYTNSTKQSIRIPNITSLYRPVYYQFSQKQKKDQDKQKQNANDQKRINPQTGDQNIKTMNVKFMDLMECMKTNNYEKGLVLTKKYIQEKERNFGQNYQNYEDDLFLLSQFTLESNTENNINKAVENALQAVELSIERKNVKCGIQAYMFLFSIWWDIQDIPEIKEIAFSVKEFAENLEVHTESRFEIINSIAQIHQEEGQFQTSVELLEEYAQDLERVFNRLQTEGQALADKKEKGLDDEEEDQLDEIQQRLFTSLLTIARTYQSLANQVTQAREWETLDKYMECIDQILASLTQEYENDKMMQAMIKIVTSRQYLYKSKQYNVQCDHKKAKEYLEKAVSIAKENKMQYEKTQTFFNSVFALHLTDELKFKEALHYLEVIDSANKSKKGQVSSVEKYRNSLSAHIKVITYSRLGMKKEAEEALKNFLEIQIGRSKRPFIKLTTQYSQAIYFECIKDYSLALEKMNMCVELSKQYFGEDSPQQQNNKLYLYKLQLLKIIQERESQEVSSDHINLISNIQTESAKCLQKIKEKKCYGEPEKEFESILKQALNLTKEKKQ